MEQTVVKQEPTAEAAVSPTRETAQKPKIKSPASKKRRTWIKRLIILAVLAALVVFLFKSCSGSGSVMAAGAYIPASAVRQELLVSVSGTGTIEPIHSYKVTTLIQGEVLEAPFEEGQTVRKGDLLFRIDSKNVEASIRQAELSLESARLNYNQLLKNQSDSQKNAAVKATAAGVVTKLYVDEGDMVSAGAPIADILDRDNLKLTVPFHSVQAASISVGQQALVSVDGTMDTLYGTVDSIAATDEVGPGGTLVRPVTIRLANPGALDNTSSGSATINGSASASSSTFAYAESKQVVAKTSGELKSLTVQEGDRVFQDQVIGGFDETDMDTQIENAAIQVKTAELTLQNARDKLEDYSITSTIDGEVIEKNYDVGDNIDATTGSTSGVTYPAVIYDLSALTFDISIHELDINKIQVGQRVEITSDALDGRSFTGTVDKVNINGATSNGVTTYPVTVRIDGSPQELKPGMNISARIIVEDAGEVLCIPVEAVSRGQNGVSLVKVAGPGALDEAGNLADPSKLEDREVTLGRNDESCIEVLSGLEEGETIFIQNAASANPWG